MIWFSSLLSVNMVNFVMTKNYTRSVWYYALFIVFMLPGVAWSTPNSNEYYAYGVKSYNSRNYVTAIQYFKNAIGLDNHNYNAMYYLALAYQQNHEYKNAAQAYLKLAMLAPNEPQGRQAKAAMMTLGKQIKELKAKGKLTPDFINSVKNPNSGANSANLNNQLKSLQASGKLPPGIVSRLAGKNTSTNTSTTNASSTQYVKSYLNCLPNNGSRSPAQIQTKAQVYDSHDIRSLEADPGDNTPNEVKIEFQKGGSNLLTVGARVWIFDRIYEVGC